MPTASHRRGRPTAPRRVRFWSEAALAVVTLAMLVVASLAHAPFPFLGAPRAEIRGPATKEVYFNQIASGRKLLGVAPSGIKTDLVSLDSFAEKIGRQPDVVEFYQSFAEPFDVPAATGTDSTGALPLDSWGPTGANLGDIAAGRDDAYIESFADQVRDYRGPIALTVGHEMNAPWSQWWGGGASVAPVFVTAWRRIHTIFAREGAENVIWVWTVNIEAGGAVGPDTYYPGAGYVDWIGVDGYFHPGLPTTFAALFGPTLADLRSHYAQPVLVVETGALDTPLRPAEIQSAFDALSTSPGVIGFIWFDYDLKSTEGVDWRLDGDQPSIAVYRRNATAPRFSLTAPVVGDTAPYYPGNPS